MGETEFLRLWDEQLATFCVEDLMPAGREAALLQPLAALPAAAERLVRRAGLCDDHRQRGAAAILAGFARVRSLDLLDELFERESERAAAAPPGSLEPLYSQAVVEDVVLAAARWCRSEALREPALRLLRKVVERTLMGEYWGSAPYALTTLVRHRAADSGLLLEAFAAFAFRSPPDHPTNPSLRTEQSFVDALQSAGGDQLSAVEDMLDRQEAEGAGVVFDPDTQDLVDRWLQLAAAVR